MSESFIADFENICSWLVQFAPRGCNLCQLGAICTNWAQFVPIRRNLRQLGAICAKLCNFSTIALLDIKWQVRCSKTWALLLYYYSRFLCASIIMNMGEGGAQKLLAWPGFEFASQQQAISMLGWVHHRMPSQSWYWCGQAWDHETSPPASNTNWVLILSPQSVP